MVAIETKWLEELTLNSGHTLVAYVRGLGFSLALRDEIKESFTRKDVKYTLNFGKFAFGGLSTANNNGSTAPGNAPTSTLDLSTTRYILESNVSPNLCIPNGKMTLWEIFLHGALEHSDTPGESQTRPAQQPILPK
jgi:hypothetical protein